MLDDFRVPTLSDEAVERIAERIGHLLTSGEPMPLDLLEILRRKASIVDELRGLEIICRPDVEMDRADAFAIPDQKRIFVATTVYQKMENLAPRALMTLAHELGHVALRHRAPAARMHGAQKTMSTIPASQSAEHQAKVFAAAFQMPSSVVDRTSTPDAIARRFNVSLEAARIRLEQLSRRGPRAPIPDIEQYLKELKAKRQTASRTSMLLTEERVWAAARTIPDEDPTEYRLSHGGYRASWSARYKMRPMGWKIENDVIVTYEELSSRGY